jgi:exonuclease SbcC
VPDPEEIHKQLAEAQKNLDELRDELTARQTRTGHLNDEAASISLEESELRGQMNALNAEISSRVSALGLRMGTGISPFEELDRARQSTRDRLQLARNAADTAEAAEHDMKAAEDELEKIRQTRTEVSRFHQDALFALQSEKSEEERFSSEGKTQEEIVNSLKRELISQIMPYGYKTLPDKNPAEIVEILAARLEAWQAGSRKCDELERELSVAHTRMTALKKERELLRQRREELASRTKTTEAERDSVKQQRIILFESRDPDSELARVAKDVEALRAQMNERRESRNEKSAELDRVQTAVHTLETEMATGREELQKHEIAFNKKLLALGFRNEDDYAAALLTPEERRDLQGKLRELTQTDFDLTTERENTKARLLELGADKMSMPADKLNARAHELKREVISLQGQAVNDADDAVFREKVSGEILPALKELMLNCGLEEVF